MSINMSNLDFTPIRRRKVFIREEIEDLQTAKKLVNNFMFQQNYSLCGNVLSSVSAICTETPMEVDESDDRLDHSRCLEDEDKKNETDENAFPPIEEYYRKKMSEGKSGKVYTRRAMVVGSKTFTNVLWGLIFCLVIVLVYFMTMGDPLMMIVPKQFDLKGLKFELEQNVLGQHTAVKDIVHNFERVDSWKQNVKIMPFVGSSGVGKTFIANIVLKYFNRRAVFSIEGSNFLKLKVQNKVLEAIKNRHFNLIIIDELQSSQMGSLFKFVKQLPKFDKKIIVIPIYNIQKRPSFDLTFKIDEAAFWQIRKELDTSGFYFEVIFFHPLDNRTLEHYVRKELVRRKIDTIEHNRIIEPFVQDKNIQYTGLKGISFRLSTFIDKMFSSDR